MGLVWVGVCVVWADKCEGWYSGHDRIVPETTLVNGQGVVSVDGLGDGFGPRPF